MKLSKKLTTVTPFSKLLALFLFILLPFLGFYFGRMYQKMVDEAYYSFPYSAGQNNSSR